VPEFHGTANNSIDRARCRDSEEITQVFDLARRIHDRMIAVSRIASRQRIADSAAKPFGSVQESTYPEQAPDEGLMTLP
jgi:hypothetical protein